jgi:hypothetical protein
LWEDVESIAGSSDEARAPLAMMGMRCVAAVDDDEKQSAESTKLRLLPSLLSLPKLLRSTDLSAIGSMPMKKDDRARRNLKQP